MTLIAVDFPALERPTKATSAPWSAGNCPGAAALIRNSARGKRLIFRLRQLFCGRGDPLHLAGLRAEVRGRSSRSPREQPLRVSSVQFGALAPWDEAERKQWR